LKKCKLDGCEKKVFGNGYCSTHYLRIRKHGDPNIKLTKWNEKLDFVVSTNGCFEVTSHKPGNKGYPSLRHYKKTVPAHRKIYEEMFGEIPEGLQVRHKCDNRLCINPEHLELGTFKENMMDKVERNRQAKGEQNGSSILTEKEVREIMILLSSKDLSQTAIARKYKVTVSTVNAIKMKRLWKHIVI
jgi:DNA-binding CsgD family transcriptional regulator